MGGDLCANLLVGVVGGLVAELFVDVFLCVRLPAVVVLSGEWERGFVGEIVADIPKGERLCGQAGYVVVDGGCYVVSVNVCLPCRSDNRWGSL